MILVHPTIPTSKVRCEAHKTYALTAVVDAFAMTTLFRTDNVESAKTQGIRLARSRNKAVYVYRLRDGQYLGHYTPDGRFFPSTRSTTHLVKTGAAQ